LAQPSTSLLSVLFNELGVLELTDIAKQTKDAGQAKDVKTAKDNTEKASIKEAIETSLEELEDDVVPDSEYGSSPAPSKEDSRAVTTPVEEPPPPVRDSSLGGID
jgi:hypothetical protein